MSEMFEKRLQHNSLLRIISQWNFMSIRIESYLQVCDVTNGMDRIVRIAFAKTGVPCFYEYRVTMATSQPYSQTQVQQENVMMMTMMIMKLQLMTGYITYIYYLHYLFMVNHHERLVLIFVRQLGNGYNTVRSQRNNVDAKSDSMKEIQTLNKVRKKVRVVTELVSRSSLHCRSDSR